MDKDIILFNAKSDMQSWLTSLTLDTLPDVEGHFQSYFRFLRDLNTLPLESPIETPSTEIPSSFAPTSIEESELKPKGLRFERKLRGGILIGESEEFFVPESIVRNLGIEHGDRVSIREKSFNWSNHPSYSYELVEKCGESLPETIRIIPFAKVVQRGHLLMAEPTVYDGLSEEERLQGFLIKTDDQRQFSLEEGDIIDIALYTNNPQSMKVMWKHSLEEISHHTPLASSAYKKKEPKEANKVEVSDFFAGKTILIVGCEPKKAEYKEKIENHGGKFDWVKGDVKMDQLESAIKRADAVVFLIRFIRHRTSIKGINYCKTHNVSFVALDTLGVDSVLNEAKKIVA